MTIGFLLYGATGNFINRPSNDTLRKGRGALRTMKAWACVIILACFWALVLQRPLWPFWVSGHRRFYGHRIPGGFDLVPKLCILFLPI